MPSTIEAMVQSQLQVGMPGQLGTSLQSLLHVDRDGLVPPVRSYKHLLRLCMRKNSLDDAKEIQARLAKHGLDANRELGELMVTTLVKCGSLADGIAVFKDLSSPTVLSWTAIIVGYAKAGQCQEAITWYERMQHNGVKPNTYTLVAVLKACSRLGDLGQGKRVHADARMQGFETDSYVGSSLVSMYSKCGSIPDAELVFRRLSDRNVVSWNAMIAAYSQQDQGGQALQLYSEMREQGVVPDDRTLVSALQACGILAEKEESAVVYREHLKIGLLRKGKVLHAEAARLGFEQDIFVGSALVSMYAKCGSLKDAEKVFEMLAQRDVVSWNAMLAAYGQQDQGVKAFQMYKRMQAEGMRPSARTLVSALQACGTLADHEEGVIVDKQNVKLHALQKGKELHAEAAYRGYESYMFVGSCLVSMYAKCGSVKDARRVFDGLSQRDVVSWNAMIGAYAQQDQGENALQIFRQMQEEGVTLDEATFLSALEACSSIGTLGICMHVHRKIVESGLECSVPLATSLIHAFGKCGSMVDAQRMFDAIAQPDVVSWTALLSGYARQGDWESSILCYKRMCLAGLKPNRVTFQALLTACCHAGMVDEGLQLFQSMTKSHGIDAELDHYVCMIDLVSRAGLFERAGELQSLMPMQPNFSLWLCVLNACRKHKNVFLGRQAFDCAVALAPEQASAYVLMSNIYAHAGMWDSVSEVDEMRHRAGASKRPGQSWIEHEQGIHSFVVGDRSHHQDERLHHMLSELNMKLEEAGCLLQADVIKT